MLCSYGPLWPLPRLISSLTLTALALPAFAQGRLYLVAEHNWAKPGDEASVIEYAVTPKGELA